MKKVLFWDFDGTLGGRMDGLKGKAWSASIWEALVEHHLQHDVNRDDILPRLGQGFPWQEPEKPHIHLNTPALWWAHIESIFKQIYEDLGFSNDIANRLSATARIKYVDLPMWELYPDTLPVLQSLAEQGWSHMIVSNHVPELRTIAAHLGLQTVISEIVNSAEVGYEKPNPEIFHIAMKKSGTPHEVWMIGDNIDADVFGARQAGIPSILVREKDPRAEFQFDDLYGVAKFLAVRGTTGYQ
ncbi:HAD family hydrolase [Paenibacillus sp. GCM10027629]|uniref:HAD family hydrolase n=1 Tax=Paenibacillus sp. GCM10027629 TaxID=3273414 RepID=UPI003630FCBF